MGTSVHIKKIVNKVQDFPMALLEPDSQRSRKFSHRPESRNKISNLWITELSYSHNLNMNRGPFIQELSSASTSLFLDKDELYLTWARDPTENQYLVSDQLPKTRDLDEL